MSSTLRKLNLLAASEGVSRGDFDDADVLAGDLAFEEGAWARGVARASAACGILVSAACGIRHCHLATY